jgi:hypothetical protein
MIREVNVRFCNTIAEQSHDYDVAQLSEHGRGLPHRSENAVWCSLFLGEK